MNWYLKVIKDYSNFDGRARRAEYWNYVLINTIIIAFLFILSLATTLSSSKVLIWIYPLYALFQIIPSIAVTVRRLHDIGKSGWFYFIVLIPLIGPIWLIVLLFTDSDEGSNEFGLNPKTIL